GLLGIAARPRRLLAAGCPAVLIGAEFGPLLTLCAITFPAVQLAVSIRDRAALTVSTGDPWNGRTLEWATASPPAAYNFAVVPHVHGIDAWWAMQQSGRAGHRPAHFHHIIMP